jgi:hypothetical protein
MITQTEIFKYGLYIESIVIDYLQNLKQYKILEKYNNDNKYDLIIQDTENNIFKIEIKGDRQAHKTNNFYVEYISHDKPSGINTTKSDILLYVVEQQAPLVLEHALRVEHDEKYIVYWINIINLKNYIHNNYHSIKIGKTKSIDCYGNFNGKFNYGYLLNINNNIYHQVEEIIKSK